MIFSQGDIIKVDDAVLDKILAIASAIIQKDE